MLSLVTHAGYEGDDINCRKKNTSKKALHCLYLHLSFNKQIN